MRIAVIPARGGSKRIPRKNIRPFCGRPMLAWSIDAARSSGLFDHIIVSTDDAEIAELARQEGAEVPFMRPAELADDHAGITEVVAHATQWGLDKGWRPDAVCCILPTAPFLRATDLRQGLSALASTEWRYAVAVTEYAAPIFRSFEKTPAGGLEMFFPEHFGTRSQDLPMALHDAGQFYWGKPEAWLSRERLFDAGTVPIVIPRWRVQDIDNEDDWERAELIAPAVMKNAKPTPDAAAARSVNSEQERFWSTTYADDYIRKNSAFDHELGAQAWAHMLRSAPGNIGAYLECGCNIGRNIEQLKRVLPDAKPSIIEISERAFRFVTSKYQLAHAFNGAILDSRLEEGAFDLVFTMGVLIHIDPDQLLDHMAKMIAYSRRYVLIGEYFNRTPTMVEYQGSRNKLFKRDFGKLFIDNFKLRLVDHGFLWGHLYDAAGFDDITWWLFEKQ